jgi:arylformamidase
MLVDLSHTLRAGMMQVPILPPVEIETFCTLAEGAATNMKTLRLSGHTGTHVDAPVHVLDGRDSIDELPLDRFVGPGLALAVTKGPREDIGAADLEAAAGGRVRPGDMVLLCTGWDRHYGAQAYLSDYPTLTLDAADWLLERGVRLVGLDTLSPDLPPARRAPDAGLVVHRRLLGNGLLIAENLTGIQPLVGRRLQVYALPIKVGAGDGAPVRMAAEIAD